MMTVIENDCLRHVFGPRHAAVNAVYEQFKAVLFCF